MTAETAYQMWGVAQPQPVRQRPVRWPTDPCDSTRTLTAEHLCTKIGILLAHIELTPDYCRYWLIVVHLFADDEEIQHRIIR